MSENNQTAAQEQEEKNEELKKRFNMVFDGGYGKLKGNTFRISNMGDETPETMRELLGNLDQILPAYLK